MTAPNPNQLRIIAEVMEAVQKILGPKIEVTVDINQYENSDVSIGWDWLKEPASQVKDVIETTYDYCAKQYKDATVKGNLRVANEFLTELKRLDVMLHDLGEDITQEQKP